MIQQFIRTIPIILILMISRKLEFLPLSEKLRKLIWFDKSIYASFLLCNRRPNVYVPLLSRWVCLFSCVKVVVIIGPLLHPHPLKTPFFEKFWNGPNSCIFILILALCLCVANFETCRNLTNKTFYQNNLLPLVPK